LTRKQIFRKNVPEKRALLKVKHGLLVAFLHLFKGCPVLKILLPYLTAFFAVQHFVIHFNLQVVFQRLSVPLLALD